MQKNILYTFQVFLSPYPLGKTPLNISVPKGLSLPPPGWVSTESYPRISDGQQQNHSNHGDDNDRMEIFC